jgi:hypothetical protein
MRPAATAREGPQAGTIRFERCPYVCSCISCISSRCRPLVLIPPTQRTIVGPQAPRDNLGMARYSALLGRRIEVTYRAGDIVLPATGNLAADSGKSIFLEESYQQKGTVKTFRWEVPYPCIVQLSECPEGPKLNASLNGAKGPAAQSALEPSALRLKDRLA